MPKDIKQLAGVLNTDDSNEVMNSTHHKMAYNIRYRDGRIENIPGTTEITNSLPSGTNECIGAFYDDLKQRIFWFNYNSSSNHGIYQYTISTGAIDKVAVVGYNTDGDIFGFTLDVVIYAVKMLYGDDTQGDILYFNNSQKEPCQINVTKALAGDYGTIERTFIDVIKAPAIMPPSVVYEDDNTVTVNNLRKRLFKFKTRYIYINKDKSVTSSESLLPLPIDYSDTSVDKDPTKNSRIAIVVPTGKPDVLKIEILAAVSGKTDANGVADPNSFSDFFLIHTINKSADSVDDNDIYTYRFYNNQAYVPIDVEESIQLQDLVPLQANDVELLNGNVPVYGGILEGYDPATISGSVTSTSETQQTTQPKFILVCNQSGDSGFGSGNIHIVVLGTITIGDVFTVYTTNQTITFTATAATTSNVITGLSAAAVTAGFTVVSSDTENLVIIKTGEALQRYITTPVTIAVNNSFVYDWNSRMSFALMYFDYAGRTIGAVTTSGLSFQTVNYTETTGTPNIPKLQLSISNRPPLEAAYFQVLRTKDLSKLKILQWVSDRTFKGTDSYTDNSQYAFISIENLNTFISNNPNSKFLQYDFSSGDRIRFIKVLSGSVNTVYTDEDYEIVGQVISPTIDGVLQQGQFLKILLPTTTSTFDFGTGDFYNYFIEIYTPAQSTEAGFDSYYEFGERYTIGNPGTVNAYHQGMTQNQTSNLSQPALFEFTQGDNYYRPRVINTGVEINYQVPEGSGSDASAGRCTLGCTFVDESYNDPQITTGSSPLNNLLGFDVTTNNDRYILKIGTGTYTFRIKGAITINFTDDRPGDIYTIFVSTNTEVITTLVPPFDSSKAGAHSFTFDVNVTLTSGQKLFIFGWSVPGATFPSGGGYDHTRTFTQTDIQITRQNTYTVNVVDRSFSDYFESKVNSNGRAVIVDSNASQVYNSTLLRWGLAYQANTNINQSNTFKVLNFDEVDRSKGDIMRLKVREYLLRIFQKTGVGQKAIYGKFIQDNAGTNVLTTTDTILTKTNINYYEGHWGIGNQPTSLTSSKTAEYYINVFTGEQIRLGNNGNTPISTLYKGKYYIKSLITPYNNDYVRADGGKAKIIQFFDFFEQQCMTILQGGTLGDSTIEDYLFSFNEQRNAYLCFYDLAPEWAISAQDKNYYWKAGKLYVQNDEGATRTLLGNSYYPSLKVVFNDKELIKKKYLTVAYQSDNYWVSDTNGDINTSMINPQTGLQQISQLKSVDYEIQENIRYAAFLRDANSSATPSTALLEGDYLEGNWIECNFTYKGSDFSWVYSPYITYSISQKNF